MNWMPPEGAPARVPAAIGAPEGVMAGVPAPGPEGPPAGMPAAPGAPPDVTGWAPAACTLPVVERPLRVAEFDQLFGAALRQVARPEAALLRLTLDGSAGVAATVRELIARETTCCSFFEFTLTGAPDHRLLLEVRVPEAQIEVLDGLATRAEAAMGGRSV